MENRKEETIKTTPSRFSRICVFCGSSSGKKSTYQDAAVQLGQELVERRIDLVYGGGSVGLMGLVSQAVHDGGRHVLGVIPRTLMPIEVHVLNLHILGFTLLHWYPLSLDDEPNTATKLECNIINVRYYNGFEPFLDAYS